MTVAMLAAVALTRPRLAEPGGALEPSFWSGVVESYADLGAAERLAVLAALATASIVAVGLIIAIAGKGWPGWLARLAASFPKVRPGPRRDASPDRREPAGDRDASAEGDAVDRDRSERPFSSRFWREPRPLEPRPTRTPLSERRRAAAALSLSDAFAAAEAPAAAKAARVPLRDALDVAARRSAPRAPAAEQPAAEPPKTETPKTEPPKTETSPSAPKAAPPHTEKPADPFPPIERTPRPPRFQTVPAPEPRRAPKPEAEPEPAEPASNDNPALRRAEALAHAERSARAHAQADEPSNGREPPAGVRYSHTRRMRRKISASRALVPTLDQRRVDSLARRIAGISAFHKARRAAEETPPPDEPKVS